MESYRVFISSIMNRSTEDLVAEREAARSAVDAFANTAELREKVRRSLGNHILSLIRGDGTEALRLGDRLGQLRACARNHSAVRVTPLVPSCRYNSFRVKAAESSVVTLEKDSN